MLLKLVPRLIEKKDSNPETSDEIIPEINDNNEESSNELDNILPLFGPDSLKSNIVKLSRKEFAEEQKKSAELKKLFEEAKNESSKKINYIVEDNLLFFKKEDKNGTKRKLLVVPEKYREKFGVKIVTSSVYHPQSNSVERMHRTLKRILRVL
ncbi:hypothetical protein AVEN_190921-1 [Araneus ventricosus]|uniref:Integrase catalytic domain-containing protein n=1 Tax=Araneus ventricosus TaxID=182803 RepID=A0A4Y2CQM9_ARAVE|nr:hypothetical protein AVEN_190921-1 [Araneus ventricosus]